ncbi:MAG: polysaccharide deacetylase family protein, partial [Sandarakinorhabdus sp.]|nr:polysaccharide deacetylase family protein [Sandarakinorhabdus sp.]
DKAVLLTFDDGYESFYTRVFPVLQARQIPAVIAVIGTWMRRAEKPDVPGDKPVLTWPQVREMAASGLVEVASHTDTMHNEVDADPQGETHAAVTTRAYLDRGGRYETDREYAARLDAGMQRSADFVTAATGHRPRVLVWPLGEYNGFPVAAARRAGMPITLALSDGVNNARADLSVVNRLLVTDDPEVPAFAAMVTSLRAERPQRAIRVNLDTVWNAVPAIAARNEARMLRQVQASGASAVYLQAYADRGGTAAAVYFPNRHLPVRADVLGATAERVKEATGAKVYALMPARVIDAPPATAARWAGDIYEDLAKYVPIDGLVLSHEALRYPAPPSNAPALNLVDASAALTARMRVYRPFIKTAVDIDEPPVRPRPAAPGFDRMLVRYLHHYDYVVIDALARRNGPAQLGRFVGETERRVGSVNRIVFGLGTTESRPRPAAPPALLRTEVAAILRSGARNIELQPGTANRRQMAGIGKTFGATAIE